mmetsp:Transcript_40344/g.48899  ORF Transcript_40344/g.48899 Transcript_40344/m.48899 type:complete len:271 (-) Transcript_40344:217-1029(-)|eukprot:CAMPEP_0197844796 /NCGR_PEP_ID=MMETSP1438-20131217/1782_1 /TAXON_ID=1461541 /ORGANISM="Pterosperma sp., Strain CCMP1384" /LENGTH=270 /DNA_ID=CAMNT_0043455777 /DNA_START=75 /DNA_END=887 /DNA_ORIENTATION=-
MALRFVLTVVALLLVVAPVFTAEYGLNYPRDLMSSPQWMQLHKQFVLEAKEAADKGGLDLLFVGDSITETWRGTEYSKDCMRCKGAPQVFKKMYGHLKAAAFGIAGDNTPHLLWRLKDGELAEGLSPKVVVVLIGTNDVYMKRDQADVVVGIQGVVDHIREVSPDTKVLITAILPRGETKHPRDPNPIHDTINLVNEGVEAMWKDKDPNVRFHNCNVNFLDKSERVIKRSLMPDYVHPSFEGHQEWAECIKPVLEDLGLPMPKKEVRDEL